MKKHFQIRVKGIVQGVGFRPFVYGVAKKNLISGYVINDTEGVLIEAEGKPKDLNNFINDIKENPPPISHIRSIVSEEKELNGFTDFKINKSRITDERLASYSPDVDVCDECLEEFFNPRDRRYLYPFITCINCGPRLSIVSDIPYDRKNTTMDSFKMCKDCQAEYDDPYDRRFHSQPNACHICGPKMSLNKIDGELISDNIETILNEAIRLIKSGKIIAIKGIGGYHLACDAKNQDAVLELRRRKERPFKPFAIMLNDLERIKKISHVSALEQDLLLSKEKPIVLLKEKEKLLSGHVAPKTSSLGTMLPYTPFQHLLFSADKEMILIMTSGNLSDEPITYTEKDTFKRLNHIADYIITYNREIKAQSDDSVIYTEMNKPCFIRRARGYIPVPFNSTEIDSKIIALGGDLKNCFAMARKDFVILSQHLGDMADPLTHEAFTKTVNHFINIFDADPDVVASDMHPSYMTTEFADILAGDKKKRVKVQHHHAHIASVIEDRKLSGKVIGIAFDGTGYGPDNTLWGSEFLIADTGEYTRAAHFSNFPLPGGESAIKDVWKIGISLLYGSFGDNIPIFEINEKVKTVIEIIKKQLNSPLTCSIGRIFDGVSAILGLSKTISTEAEAAIILEEEAMKSTKNIKTFTIPFTVEDEIIINTGELIKHIVSLMNKGETISDIAYSFHHAIAHTSVEVAKTLREQTGINQTALSGGVFHNRILLSLMHELLEKSGFEVFTPEKVPFNDGCIALGQIAVAKKILLT
ncbi:carbamoyltransferase HypF [Spirochaetota bacterium]